MRRRRTGTIPLARWLTSQNPALREQAETVLYHLGPDAGVELLHAAEQESKWVHQRRVLWFFPLEILLAVGVFSLLRTVAEVQTILLVGMVGYLTARATWQLLEGTVSRRSRLRTLALALARRNDLRSIGPLIDVWRPLIAAGVAVRDDDVEHELNRLLPVFMAQNRLTLRSDKLSRLRRKVRRLAPVRSRAHDLPDARADLLITLLQLFARTGGEENHAILERLARAHVSKTAPNRELIRDAAEVLLTVAAAPAEAPQTVVTTPVMVPLRRPLSNHGAVVPAAAVPLTLKRP